MSHRFVKPWVQRQTAVPPPVGGGEARAIDRKEPDGSSHVTSDLVHRAPRPPRVDELRHWKLPYSPPRYPAGRGKTETGTVSYRWHADTSLPPGDAIFEKETL